MPLSFASSRSGDILHLFKPENLFSAATAAATTTGRFV